MCCQVWGLGLHFHSRYVELQFLEEYSRSHHWTIIAGYVIQALVAISFYLLTIILDYRSVRVYSTELAYQVLFQDDPQSKNLLKVSTPTSTNASPSTSAECFAVARESSINGWHTIVE